MNDAVSLILSPLDARVLRGIEPLRVRAAQQIAQRVGCGGDVAASCLRRLSSRALVEVDGCRPTGWLRTDRGDVVLEHQP